MTTQGSPGAGSWGIEGATADLAARIQAGDFRLPDGSPGRLPAARVLGEQYGLSRPSMNTVIANLRAQGFVETRPGARGAMVRDLSPVAFLPQREIGEEFGASSALPPPLIEALSGPREPCLDIVTAEPADEGTSVRLGLRVGEHIAVCRSTELLDGVPIRTEDRYVPLRLVDGTDWMLPGSLTPDRDRVLAELGHAPARAVDELRPRSTTEEENLRLRTGGPVHTIEIVSTSFDHHDLPVQVTVRTLPGPRNTVVYERRRPAEGSA